MGFPRSYKSPPKKQVPWIRCVVWTLSIAVGITLTFFLCVFLIWSPNAANGMILIVCIVVPVLLIAAGIHAVKVLKTGRGKKPLAILSICLAAIVLADTAVFFISRRSDNVYDEIYYAMRDADFPGKGKLPRSGYERGPFLDDIVTHWYAYLGHESKFRAWDSGDYTDIGYREADAYIHEIVKW